MAGLDKAMETLLTTYQIPGAALAVSYKGALIYARGFGYADTASSTPVQPDSLFRIASTSKIFTSAVALKLIELGKLQVDQPAFALLSDLQPAPGKTMNPELASITIRELLSMTSGLIDNAGTIGPDPMQDTVAIAAAMKAPSPATCDTVIRYELSEPLQSLPGTTYAYSNLGYCVLDAIIRRVTGLSYEAAVRQYVLAPLNIGRAKMADPLLSDKLNGEVTYYDYPGAPLAQNIFDPSGPKVPEPYGGNESNFLAKEATGGWVTSPIDLLRLINGWDGLRGGPLFAPSTIQLMETEAQADNNASYYYGVGMEINRVSNGFDWSKGGGYSGTLAFVFRYWNGLAYAVAFNSEPAAGSIDYETPIETALSAVPSFNLPDQLGNFQSTLKSPVLAATNPVVSGATFQPGIVSGSWLSITGTNLATASRIWRSDEFLGDDFSQLPLTVDSVTVTIDGKPAPVYYVSPTQLNVQAPTDSTTGPVTVIVTHDGQASAPVQANLESNAPGFFTYASGSNLFAAAVHLNGSVVGDPSAVPGTSAAKAGETIEIFGTGFAPSTAGTVNVPVAALNPGPVVTIGGQQAVVTFGGIVGPGLYQVNVVVPNMASGVYPVQVSVNGTPALSTPMLFISN
jgi:N-acyl-D-amino-acid deacylase